MRPLQLDKDKLLESYTRTRSIIKTAEELDCCSASIYNYLKRNKLPIIHPATHRRHQYSREKLIELYQTKTLTKIAREIGVSTSIIQKWFKKEQIPLRSHDEAIRLGWKVSRPTPSLEDPDVWYLLGVLYGDGCIYQLQQHNGKWHKYNVALHAKDQDFVRNFAMLLEKFTGRPKTPYHVMRHGFESWAVKAGSYQIYKMRQDMTLEKIEQTLQNKPDYTSKWLQGLFDSEGWIQKQYDQIGFANTDHQLILLVQELMHHHWQIISTIREHIKPGQNCGTVAGRPIIATKTGYELQIRRKTSIQKFWTHIGFTIQRKQTLAPKQTN